LRGGEFRSVYRLVNGRKENDSHEKKGFYKPGGKRGTITRREGRLLSRRDEQILLLKGGKTASEPLRRVAQLA